MKAEELKEKAKIPNDAILAVVSVISKGETALDLEKEKKYRFTETELQQYTDEVSRERVVKFMIYAQGLMFSNKTNWLSTLTFSKSIEQLYDKWKSKQEQP